MRTCCLQNFAKQIICSRFFSTGFERDFGAKGSSAAELLVMAGNDSVARLSPFFFFKDCVGREFSAAVGCAQLSLAVPVTSSRFY